jgi:methylmalonyl-CoA/ethylmalonyl-CoA epimerase
MSKTQGSFSLSQLPFKYKLDHIGIAVRSLVEGEKPYLALGFTAGKVEEVVSDKVRVKMFEMSNDSRIELLEPLSDDSPVAKFLVKRGPGIHHICLRVENIRQSISQLKEHNVRLINEVPTRGAHGCEIVFIHPASMGGVLIELSEMAKV